ncbi:hypothetical protein ACWDWO_07000 [Actinopolymorpha singaporensis]|uniref:Uncharacterized protein n=1 Tax=Actinopolymorpha singaporensis TaxID=117157 RepID=A0A1H1R9H6_9ACTN|nr:hypothetical protein [Actinopolymorpha singaporensis]SDS32353.1 hypothetical protein SAMN04489717_2329 [Actinopolymorpha singaporensis]
MTQAQVAVDVYTRLGQHGTHVCDPLARDELRAWGEVSWDVTPEEHRLAGEAAGTSVVLAFDGEPVGVVVPNDYVAAAGLRKAAALCRGLGPAEITDDDVDRICQRDSLALLGLGVPRDGAAAPERTVAS